VTIFDVAEAAGVSITTISHVYSGKRPVSEATRERVLATAAELGYQPHKGAQALARGRTMTLALQVSMSSQEVVLSTYYTEIMPALSEAAVALGYAFVIVPTAPNEESFITPILSNRSIDGAIVVDPRLNDPFVAALQRRRIPFVSAGRVLDGGGAPVIDNDHDRICADTLAHLREQGYRQIAMIAYPPQTSYPVDVCASFRTRNPDGPIEIASELTERAGFEAACSMLDSPHTWDALFCVNDVLAAGALRAAQERSVGVPDELAIVGVGDSVLATRMRPELTSTRVWPDRVGSLLVETLDRLLNGEPVERLTLVPTELIARESSTRRR
jgi:DNA-binding LacI/PurR family transcriptional regulator